MKNDLCTVLTEKVIRKKEKSNFIIKKHNVATKESIKKSRVTKVNLNEAEMSVYFGRLHTAQFCEN